MRSCFALIALIAGTGLLAPSISAQASGEDTAPLATEPPVIPVEKPLFSGHPLPKEAWTEYRYWAYNFVMPGLRESAQTSLEMVTRYGFGQVEGDTLRDQSENENDGIAHDVEIVRSERGAAGLFDGRGYVELETSSSDLKALRPNEKSLTVGGWVRPDASDGVVASFGGQIEGFSLYLRDGLPEFAIRGLGQQSVVSGSERLPRNEWAHLAARLTADRQLHLYVNGKRVAATKAARFIESVPRDCFLVGPTFAPRWATPARPGAACSTTCASTGASSATARSTSGRVTATGRAEFVLSREKMLS